MVSVKLTDVTAIYLRYPLLIFNLGYEISIHERAKRQREVVLLLRTKAERCMCEATADADACTHGGGRGLDHEECREDYDQPCSLARLSNV